MKHEMWIGFFNPVRDHPAVANIQQDCRTTKFGELLAEFLRNRIEIEFAGVCHDQMVWLEACELAGQLAANTSAGAGYKHPAIEDHPLDAGGTVDLDLRPSQQIRQIDRAQGLVFL